MEFEKRKAATMAALDSTETDKSPKGSLDIPIFPLIKTLNLHSSYFTTSSCSGRISILSQPTTTSTTTTINKKARGGSWLFITHDPADPDSVLNLLFPSESTHPPTQPHDLVFRFEPLIIAVECKDLDSAQSLVSLAISCGFRESGITNTHKRVIIAIRCSIRLEVPLGDTSRIMVSPEYVRYLVELANDKMEANRKRTDGFLRALHCNGFPGPEIEEGDAQKLIAREDENNGSVCEAPDCSNNEKNTQNGSLGVPGCSLTTVRITIVGEPVERLFIWGHSACTMPNDKKLLVFGGFGGIGRHARRNDCLLLDPLCGTLKSLNVDNAPSPRLGHTSSLVGDFMYVIGGRADPVTILNDVWVLNTAKNKWSLLECTRSVFPPRHRHAAAIVGSRIYVFGGLNNDNISSSLHVLDTDSLQWSEISVLGEWPSARHSHSLVAYGSHLYMFGGYNGEKALGDFYSFDVQTCLWKKERTTGRTPYARFSHSMFVYKNFLGIIGGCPIRQHCEELALLDLQLLSWRHVMLNSFSKDLLVRSTTNIVGDDLVVIGGGASIYAFGTKFSEPMIINMHLLTSLDKMHMPSENGERLTNRQYEGSREIKSGDVQNAQYEIEQTLTVVPDSNSLRDTVASHWVLELERKYAKLGKDMMKKFGWLDLRRKVYTREDKNKTHICFPVIQKFCAIFQDRRHLSGDAVEGMSDLCTLKTLTAEGLSLNEVSCLTALNFLMNCGAALVVDEVVEIRKSPSSPLNMMSEAVASLIKSRGLSAQLLEQLPTRWERLGDIIVLPATSFQDPIWDSIGEELWPVIAKSLRTHRLARQGRVAPTGTRDSTLEILVGDNGWVEHRENTILYSFDATKCMFSWGNLSEKLRMARLDCKDEVIVDLFAGIGYFVLPFLVGAKAKFVYACEWNPYAVEALRHNLQANSVTDRSIILEGDNRITAPKGVANRVCLGLLPTSEGSWVTAVRALRLDGFEREYQMESLCQGFENWQKELPWTFSAQASGLLLRNLLLICWSEGGTLHVHANVKDTEEAFWAEYVSKSIYELALCEGRHWEVSVEHVERVKWYAPHIRHLVLDVRCKQIQKEGSE